MLFFAGTFLPSYAQMRTAKQLVAMIPPDAVVAQIGEYQASAVFYYGQAIPRIVFPNEEKSSSVWAGKQRYPLLPMEVFERQSAKRKDVYLIVHEYSNEAFLRMHIARAYRPIAVSSRGVLYQKVFS